MGDFWSSGKHGSDVRVFNGLVQMWVVVKIKQIGWQLQTRVGRDRVSPLLGPLGNLWLVGNGRMVVMVVNCTPFLHSLLAKGKQ